MLKSKDTTSLTRTITVYPLADNFDEETISYNNRPQSYNSTGHPLLPDAALEEYLDIGSGGSDY